MADRVRVVFRSVRTEVFVLFIATLEGIIKKFFLLPQPMEFNGTNVSTCFLEELHLMPSDQPQAIRQLELVRTRVNTSLSLLHLMHFNNNLSKVLAPLSNISKNTLTYLLSLS